MSDQPVKPKKRKHGPVGATLPQYDYDVTCSGCGERVNTPPRKSTAETREWLTTRGWTVVEEKYRCPDCGMNDQ